ncbi:phosphatidylserine decarboxylase [Campylobacter concisus]|uniref:Phosphatidylserine decarboxylase n=1 Tax=Campylobacter concisus TaxID=199 RepID=A0A2R4P1B2_9BACT|nr:hypothetical protein [Campylobacter concisus]AVX44463.1 Phosphatidylserine decarboxylase [Campylobacter concisus]
MKFSFDERIQTNVVANFTQIYKYEKIHIKKGERLGISSLAQLSLYLAKKIRPNLTSLENKELKFTEAIRLIK